MQLVVGRIAKAHGVGGEVSVEVRTDVADERYATGARLETDPADRGPLQVERTRWHAGRLLVQFAGVSDRTTAELLRGTMLVVDSTTCPPPEHPEDFWDHDLVGLRAETTSGAPLGVVTDVLHPPGPDVLVVRREDRDAASLDGAAEVMIPFVSALVPVVDLGGGRVVVDPPEGLLEL
jgi:16S rRNA processing protein RimM